MTIQRVRTIAATAIAILAGLTVSGAAASGSAVAAPPDITGLGLPSGHISDETTSSYSTIFEKLFLPHPTEWGGAYVDGDTLVVTTVTRSSAEAAAVLKALGVKGSIKVVRGTVSMADLDAATQAIASSKDLAGKFTSVGPDYSQSRIIVGVASANTQNAKVVDFETTIRNSLVGFDGDSIGVAVFSGGVPVPTSRYYDTSPFYGGDNINFKGPAGAYGCSGGFSWANGANNYVVSASHCAVHPTLSALTVSRVLTNNSVSAIGAVTWTSGGNSGTSSGKHGDLSVVLLNAGLTNSARIFTGTNNSVTTRIVRSQQSLPQGAHYSTLRSSGSGPFYGNGTGEIDPDWISLVNQTISYNNGQTFANLTIAQDASDCFGEGDSGGAVYLQRSDGAADAVGIISGDDGGGFGLSNCLNYYTPIAYVTSDFGGHLKIG